MLSLLAETQCTVGLSITWWMMASLKASLLGALGSGNPGLPWMGGDTEFLTLYMLCVPLLLAFSLFLQLDLSFGDWGLNVKCPSHWLTCFFIPYHQRVVLLWSLQETELWWRKWTTVGGLWDFKPNLTSCSLPVSWLAAKISLFTLATMASSPFRFKLFLFRHFGTVKRKITHTEVE